MSNDPREQSVNRLQKALYILGRNVEARTEFIDLLKKIEIKLNIPGVAVREEIIGPIIDALHDENDVYEKILTDGTYFRFLFRTKIARDFLLSEQVNPDHVWEPQTTNLMLYLSKRSNKDVVIGGAYFGDQAIMVAKNILARNGVVHGFEPNLAQANMFEENVKLNNLPNVRVNRFGLWSESSIKLKLDGFDSFANVIKAEEDDDGFQTISIDDYCLRNNVRVGLIQLDIEGAELSALNGAIRTLKDDRPDIIFEVHRSYVDWSAGLEKTAICQLLLNLGYKIYAVRDINSHFHLKDRCIELIPIDKVFLEGPPHGFNMVAVMNDDCFNNDKFRFMNNVSPKLLSHKDPKLHHPKNGM